MMLTDDNIQRVFRLVYSLHPNRVLAWEITQEALRHKRSLECAQASRPSAAHPFKQRLEEDNLLRKSVFLSSLRWEKDQESRAPKLCPAYRPTSEDLLFRFLKALVLQCMDRRPIYAAVGMGALLYSYATSEVACVAPDFFDDPNIRRVKRFLLRCLDERFRNVMLITDGNAGRRSGATPTIGQTEFVMRGLSTLAPEAHGHPGICRTRQTLLEEYFSGESGRSDAERIHVILHPGCGGWGKLVEEFNAGQSNDSEFLLADPEGRLRIPSFGGDFEGPGTGANDGRDSEAGVERFDPEPLNPVEIRSLRQSLDEPERTAVFHPGRYVA